MKRWGRPPILGDSSGLNPLCHPHDYVFGFNGPHLYTFISNHRGRGSAFTGCCRQVDPNRNVRECNKYTCFGDNVTDPSLNCRAICVHEHEKARRNAINCVHTGGTRNGCILQPGRCERVYKISQNASDCAAFTAHVDCLEGRGEPACRPPMELGDGYLDVLDHLECLKREACDNHNNDPYGACATGPHGGGS